MVKTRLEIDIELEAERIRALENQDANRYANLCDELGISEDNVEDVYLYNLRNVDKAYNNSLNENKAAKKTKTRKKRFSKKQASYNELKAKADKSGVNVENIVADIEIKIKHLSEIMNYRGLYVGKGERIALKDAKPSRIGEAYKKCYKLGD